MSLRSCLCRFDHFGEPWFAEWSRLGALGDLGRFAGFGRCEAVKFHRKTWEYVAIAQALQERECLAPGKRGLGFAVGAEPLVSLFASFGPKIVATDWKETSAANGWAATGQYTGAKEGLWMDRLVEKEKFDANVEFENVDMRNPATYPKGKFDFIWSACAFEHLGTLEAGLAFVEASSKLLAPGGIAVHTTEFNVSSNTKTLTSGSFVLYRRQDMDRLSSALARDGFTLLPFDFNSGNHQHDVEPDFEPWYRNGREHVKLLLGGYVATSAILVIEAPCQ